MGKENKLSTTEFLEQFKEIASKREVTISNIDQQDPMDRFLVLGTALRGKTADEYFDIVGALFEKMDKIKDTDGMSKEWEEIHHLTSRIMWLGESVMGIDWS